MDRLRYRHLHGTFVVGGHAPDGGTLRFVPDRLRELDSLPGTHRLRLGTDGSVPVKLEGIDAPEVNYEGYSQPLGQAARDALLAAMGFSGVVFDGDGFVRGARVESVRGNVRTRGVDIEGRVIAYVSGGSEEAPVRECVNALLLRCGHAYPLAYDTQSTADRDELRSAARVARRRLRGVWPFDRTERFAIDGLATVLVWPKLFRRAIAFRGDGHRSFQDWLNETPGENDVVVDGRGMTRLSAVVRESDDMVSVAIRPTDAVFVAR